MLRVRTALSGWSGGPGLTTVYFDPDTSDDTAAAAAVAHVHTAFDGVKAIFPSIFRAQVSGDVDIINPSTGEITGTLSVTAPAVVGGGGGDASYMAPTTAALLSMSTGAFIGGRRVRGRIFLSPLYSTMVDGDGTPSSTVITRVNQFGDDLALATGADGAYGVWHRPVSGGGGEWAVVSSSICKDRFAVLRSRRP